MTKSEIQQYVYDFLYDKNLPHNSICAIMGNITAESSWNPVAIEKGSGIGFGLCQWSYGRRDQLEAYGTSLKHQCEFLWSELTGENRSATGANSQWYSNPADSVDNGEGFKLSLKDFLEGNASIEVLTKAFCYCWERPAYSTNHLQSRRIPSAIEFRTTMRYKSSGPIPGQEDYDNDRNLYPGRTGPNDDSNFTADYNEDYTTILPIVGKRVSELSSQPMHAYVQISIGGKPLSKKPQYMQNFEITRYMGAGDTAEFTIFDDTWSDIETDFSNNWSNIEIQYGYYGGVTSNMYHMQLTTYSLNFNSTGTLMTAKAISHGSISNIQTKRTIRTDTANPTEAVRKICEHMGWIVDKDNFDDTYDVGGVGKFNCIQDFPVTYIMESILPYARCSEAPNLDEIMNFYLDSSIVPVAYFKADGYRSDISKNNIRTYIFQKGYDSPILDLTFDIKGTFGGTSEEGIASGLGTSVFDPDTKEEVKYEEDISSVATSATGEVISMKSNQSIPSIDGAGYDLYSVKSRLYYEVKKDVSSHYEASMTIVGDPTIKLLDNIRIINVTDDGYLHYTSGIYMIKGITDHVSGGSMTTTLKLVRNGQGLVEEGKGVEIISPKILVK